MFTSIEYLKTGNERQQKCYGLLNDAHIFETLHSYRPVLVGTIPLGIDLPGSDLDIICEASYLTEFQMVVRQNYSDHRNFTDRLSAGRYVAECVFNDHKIEIFAKMQTTLQQAGYRHMLVEYRLLQLLGNQFRQDVIRLKSDGHKTEPAFAILLGLTGNPYQALLELEKLPDKEILQLFPPAR